MSNEREIDELVAKLALYDDRLSMDCRRVITALRQERDTTLLLVRDDAKWAQELESARAENKRLRALLLTIHDALVPPSWIRDRIEAALRREET
jgi:hypothetical protein